MSPRLRTRRTRWPRRAGGRRPGRGNEHRQRFPGRLSGPEPDPPRGRNRTSSRGRPRVTSGTGCRLRTCSRRPSPPRRRCPPSAVSTRPRRTSESDSARRCQCPAQRSFPHEARRIVFSGTAHGGRSVRWVAPGTWGLSNRPNALVSGLLDGRPEREIGECGTFRATVATPASRVRGEGD